MFIKQLYRYNKMLCLIFIMFILSFVFINYKQGVVATPIFQYGMFSSKFYLKDTQNVFKIYVNDSLLDLSNFSFEERDMLLVVLESYGIYKARNEAVYKTMKQLYAKFRLENIMKPEVYLINITDETFTKWYMHNLEDIIGYPVLKLAIFQQGYQFQNKELKEVSSPKKLDFIVVI